MFSLDLEKAWGDYFEQPKNKGTWRGWNPQQTVRNIIAGAFSDALDGSGQGDLLQQIDAVLFVVQTASEGLTVVGTKIALAKSRMPHSHEGRFLPAKAAAERAHDVDVRRKADLFMPSHLPGGVPATEALKEKPPRTSCATTSATRFGCPISTTTATCPTSRPPG